jgi:L-threonylcarbamoyladenylate synthase
MRRVFVDHAAPQRDAIEEAGAWIRGGGVIAIPTDTFYGLAADPMNPAAVARVFAVKGRSGGQALPLIAANVAQIARHIGPLSRMAERLAAHFWPGPLTLVMPAPVAFVADVSGGTGQVGVRVPADAIARAVCAAAGGPVTATSANISGEPATADPDDIERTLGDVVDFLLDTGRTPGGAPSTVLDITADEPRVVRAGAVSWDDIQRCLQHV